MSRFIHDLKMSSMLGGPGPSVSAGPGSVQKNLDVIGRFSSATYTVLLRIRFVIFPPLSPKSF